MTKAIINGNSLEELKKFEPNTVDSVVTDPPYGLSFMNKHWDYDVPSVELWQEVLRVLKPGGHLLSFAGSRTYHRMAVNIEDAGFEIRDQIMWVYGSGFPKSLNIGKAVDKLQGNERTPYERPEFVARSNKTEQRNSQVPSGEKGKYTKGNSPYEGWGTALKPAHEPIVVARKPISEKSIAENTLKWGTGGINIDGCRVDYASDADKKSSKPGSLTYNADKRANIGLAGGIKGMIENNSGQWEQPQGRFPANFIHDGSDEVVGLFPTSKSTIDKTEINRGTSKSWFTGDHVDRVQRGDSGSAARFFYCAKAGKSERNKGLEEFEERFAPKGNNDGRDMDNPKNHLGGMQSSKMTNHHPTVKPIKLMQYLVKLVTPTGGTVLDPFNGSGTTGIACKLEGFNYIGIELDPEYVAISEARIAAHAEEQTRLV